MNKELDQLCVFGYVEKDVAIDQRSNRAGEYYIRLTREMVENLSDDQANLLKVYCQPYLESVVAKNSVKRLKTKDSTWESFLIALDEEVAKNQEKEEKSREEKRLYEARRDRERKEQEEMITKAYERFKNVPGEMLAHDGRYWFPSKDVEQLPSDHFMRAWASEEVFQRNRSREKFEKMVKEIEENNNRRIEQDFLNFHGTDSQKERFLENLLPEEELINLAKSIFFKDYDQFKRFERYSREDVNGHLNALANYDLFTIEEHDIDRRYEDDSSALTECQWEAWKKIRDLSKDHLNTVVERRSHTAGPEEDLGYDRYLPKKKYVKVTILWAGRKLSKCYLLA